MGWVIRGHLDPPRPTGTPPVEGIKLRSVLGLANSPPSEGLGVGSCHLPDRFRMIVWE